MKKFIKQAGQGMTEYIIIVALIAIAAIGVYTFFGDALRNQMTSATQELAGQSGTAANTAAATNATDAAAANTSKGLSDFSGGSAANK